jgi:hypothetical protein
MRIIHLDEKSTYLDLNNRKLYMRKFGLAIQATKKEIPSPI